MVRGGFLLAENLFLRKQQALYKERKVKPRRASRSTKLTLLVLSKFFDSRDSLVIVQPETFLRWHRQAFRMFWRWKSRKKGRPPLPKNLQELIRRMARENPVWGEEQIANDLLLKLGIRVSPRTVRKYLESQQATRDFRPSLENLRSQSCRVMVACDFFVSVTARASGLWTPL